MRRTIVAGLSCLALMVAAQTALALRAIGPVPVPQRVAQAEMVIVGKVTAIEQKAIKTQRFPGDAQPMEYSIAVVKVDEALSGAKGLTHVKVGFLPAQGGAPVPPGDTDGQIKRIRPIRPPFRGAEPVTLVKDQEVCLFLQQHHKESFYVIANNGAVDRKADNFAQEVAEAKKYGQLLNDPMTGLKSKDAEERFKTAALLLTRYRQPLVGASKQEPIDAAESKLILEALAGADWTPRPGKFGDFHPQTSFFQLQLTPKDGWTQPTDFQQLADSAKEWLKSNAGTYRIQRFVVEEKK